MSIFCTGCNGTGRTPDNKWAMCCMGTGMASDQSRLGNSARHVYHKTQEIDNPNCVHCGQPPDNHPLTPER